MDGAVSTQKAHFVKKVIILEVILDHVYQNNPVLSKAELELIAVTLSRRVMGGRRQRRNFPLLGDC